MKYDKQTGKRIRHPSEFTKCMDCGSPCKKDYKRKGIPKRCRKCRDLNWAMHPETSPRFKTGRIVDANGYITVAARWHPHCQASRGRILEHRLVMEKKLGRYLKPNEIVHHINGKRGDNDPKNLVLCQSDKEHFAYHVQPPCMICKRPHRGRGYCNRHYLEWSRAGSDPRGILVEGKWFMPLAKVRNFHH